MTTPARLMTAGLSLHLLTALAPGTAAATAAGNPWSQAASMAQPHQAATATLLPNGKVLVVGSFSQLNTGAELYDPIADRWSPGGTMIVARALGTATLLPSGKVLVAGGIAADTGHSTTRSEIYDPAANAWSPAAGMAVPRSIPSQRSLTFDRPFVVGILAALMLLAISAALFLWDRRRRRGI
jgi:Galactose oxidase, central domain